LLAPAWKEKMHGVYEAEPEGEKKPEGVREQKLEPKFEKVPDGHSSQESSAFKKNPAEQMDI
jgi:hypothetical protein